MARYPVVSPAYFALMSIPLLQGRLLQDSDGPNALPVVIVSQSLVSRYFEGENPIGKHVQTGSNDQPWRTIVGIVGDVKASGLASAAEPAMYLPYRQADIAEVGVLIRSPLSAGVVASEFRQAIAGLDANQPVATAQSMNDRLNESVSGPRFSALLLVAFAALAIVLGLIGVYGVTGCRVRWQLRELAIRQALGAQPREVAWHVLRQGIGIILAGLLIGLLGSISLSRLLASMLYEVSPHDPLTLSVLATGLTAVALLACWIPAIRVAGSDPLELLRHD